MLGCRVGVPGHRALAVRKRWFLALVSFEAVMGAGSGAGVWKRLCYVCPNWKNHSGHAARRPVTH